MTTLVTSGGRKHIFHCETSSTGQIWEKIYSPCLCIHLESIPPSSHFCNLLSIGSDRGGPLSLWGFSVSSSSVMETFLFLGLCAICSGSLSGFLFIFKAASLPLSSYSFSSLDDFLLCDALLCCITCLHTCRYSSAFLHIAYRVFSLILTWSLLKSSTTLCWFINTVPNIMSYLSMLMTSK